LPEVPEQYVHRIGRTARAGAEGQAVAFCAPDERGLLRDIERLTRQKIDVAPLPAGFVQAAEALKRLKPAPKVVERPQRGHGHATKSDRRADGQRREQRNDRQRHPNRASGNPGHRPAPQDRNGQRRDDQRGEGSRSSYRPEAFREADAGPRPARPSDGRGNFRPSGGQPKREFHGRPRRPGGGPRRAQG